MANFESGNAPKGWIKLKTTIDLTEKTLYFNVSKIVCVGHPIFACPHNVTPVYTIGTEDNPWLVDESIDEVMEKIKNA